MLRWFVSIASEGLMRKWAIDMIGDNLVVEKVVLTFPLKDGGGGRDEIWLKGEIRVVGHSKWLYK